MYDILVVMERVLSLLFAVAVLIACVCSYDVYDFESMCGKTITVGKDQQSGMVRLERVSPQTAGDTCQLVLTTTDDDLVISVALQELNFPNCKGNSLQLHGYSSITSSSKTVQSDKIIFDTYPDECGKVIYYPQPLLLNDNRTDSKIAFHYKIKAGAEHDSFKFSYSVVSADGAHVWQNATDTPVEDLTSKSVDKVTSRPVKAVTTNKGEDMTSKVVEYTTSKPVNDMTSKPVEYTTSKPVDDMTSKFMDDMTSKPTEYTTSKHVDDMTSKPMDDTTSKPMDDMTSKPKDDMTSKPVEYTTSKPVGNMTSKLMDDMTSKPAEYTTSKPVDDVTSKLMDDMTFKPTEYTTSKPVDDMTSKPMDDTTSIPMDDMTTKPKDNMTSKPVEYTTSKLVGNMTSKLMNDMTSKPMDDTTFKPMADMTSKPAEYTTSKPVDDVTSKLMDDMTSKPTEYTTSKPVVDMTSKPMDDTTFKPMDDMTSKPVEYTTSKPVDDMTSKLMDDMTSKPTEYTTSKPVVDMTSKPMDDTTFKPMDDMTSKPVEYTTSKPVDDMTSKPMDDMTSKPAEYTTSQPVDDMTSKQAAYTTSKPNTVTTYKPVEHNTTLKPTTTVAQQTTKTVRTTSGFALETRLCKCDIWIRGYGAVGEEKKIDVSYITYKFASESIDNSNCQDQNRCGKVCNDYMLRTMPQGLFNRRTRFSEETIGDYVCNSVGKPILAGQPGSVALTTTARGCTGHSFVRSLSFRFCCVGELNSFRAESCSNAMQNVLKTTEPTTVRPRSTRPSTRRPVVTLRPAPRRCKCEVKTSINGERDLKADVSYVTYRFMRASITNSDCSDLHRCADVCRDYMNQNMPRGLKTIRQRSTSETAGDYVCNRVNHQVVERSPARVTLVTSARGCTGEMDVTLLNANLCCSGRSPNLKARDCFRASDSVVG